MPKKASPRSATTYDEAALRSMIAALRDRFKPLHDRIEFRRKHFHNMPEADPVLPAHFGDVTKFQSDLPRRKHVELKARLTENHFVVHSTPPRATATQTKLGNDFEAVMNSGLQLIEEREELDIQGALADGQIIDCFGVLHWRKHEHELPKLPGYEAYEAFERDLDQGERKRFKPRREKDGDYAGKFRETDDSLQQRYRHSVAMAGFPWYVECPAPETVMWERDKSIRQGFKTFVVINEVGLFDYQKGLASDGIALEAAKDGSLSLAEDAPPDWAPSASNWGTKVELACVWTRDEYYELVAGVSGAGGWTLVKSHKHPYEMPPFALCPATTVASPDNVLAYEPALEGVFRIKPAYDRITTLMHVLAEQIALPFYYLEAVAGGSPLMAEDGTLLTFTKNNANAMKIPDGYTIKMLPFELNPAFVLAVQMYKDEIDTAAPDTGRSEVGASTQPWAIRLQQAEASVPVGDLLKSINRAINIMARNMALVMSKPADAGGFGMPIWTFRREKDGKVDSTATVGVEPKDILTLQVDASISGTSQAEQITQVKFGQELLEAGLITPLEWIEDYEGKPNPEQTLAKRMGWQMYMEHVHPGLAKQEMAKRFGSRYVLGSGGEIIGPDGMPVPPEQVLQANGMQPVMPQQPGMVGGQSGGSVAPMVGPSPPTTMGDMSGIQAPNTVPLQGVVG